VSSSYYISIRVLILLHICLCPHTSAILQSRPYSTTIDISQTTIYVCVLILLYMYVSSYYYICLCPHTTIYVCVLILLYMYVSSHCTHLCVLILLYMYVSSHCAHITTHIYYSYTAIHLYAVAAVLARHGARPSHARYGIQRLTRAARNTFSAVSGLSRLC
jgi:hypothetical protein